jgi:hypothetical protein
LDKVTNAPHCIDGIDSETIQAALSTYLHETVHWWQHIGSTAGLVSSLAYIQHVASYSLAIAKPDDLDHGTFMKRASAVCDWFKPLNPYGDAGSEHGSILQIEDINYRSGGGRHHKGIEPLYCFAVSAKRPLQQVRGWKHHHPEGFRSWSRPSTRPL